jgi:type VI secretion system protein ImpB
MSSINNKLERVRKPRVHIKYEVETEDSIVSKELPFVVGVLGDFSGDSTELQKPLRERKFVQIDRDNFDEVMQRMTPGAKFSVANTIQDDNSELAVNLKFSSIEDFEPAKVAEQIPAVKNLLDTRNKLRDLLTKVDRSEDLESLLEKVLQNSEELQKLSQELSK